MMSFNIAEEVTSTKHHEKNVLFPTYFITRIFKKNDIIKGEHTRNICCFPITPMFNKKNANDFSTIINKDENDTIQYKVK